MSVLGLRYIRFARLPDLVALSLSRGYGQMRPERRNAVESIRGMFRLNLGWRGPIRTDSASGAARRCVEEALAWRMNSVLDCSLANGLIEKKVRSNERTEGMCRQKGFNQGGEFVDDRREIEVAGDSVSIII